MPKQKNCVTEHCENDVRYQDAGLCAACYSRARYWTKKTVTQRMRRQRQLKVLSAAMVAMDPSVRVATPSRKRRKIA